MFRPLDGIRLEVALAGVSCANGRVRCISRNGEAGGAALISAWARFGGGQANCAKVDEEA